MDFDTVNTKFGQPIHIIQLGDFFSAFYLYYNLL